MITSTRIDRKPLLDWYAANRRRSALLFGSIDPEAFLDRPIPLRHPPIFYEGHIPAFTYNTLLRKALGAPSINADFEVLFERGIDPSNESIAGAHARSDWPSRDRIAAFADAVDRAVLATIADAAIDDGDASPLLERAQAVYTILEHEEMHHETLLYLMLRLPLDRKAAPFASRHIDQPAPNRGRVEVATGEATLGALRDRIVFAWDNELDGATIEVPRFSIDVNPVTNGEYVAFVEATGAAAPSFWFQRNGNWMLRAMFDELPLPLSWPVYATNDQAAAFAAWRGGRLPTEAEYHRAAYGTPHGDERRYPWGDLEPAPEHGNFDFQRFDPEPVGSRPAGASAWGVNELVGNGWEWTATPFGPLPGFEPMASYPQYSADFFDGRHFVVKGASPVTARTLIRRSLRNWFYADYPYMFAKFRTVSD